MLYPLQTSDNLRFSKIFKVYKIGAFGINRRRPTFSVSNLYLLEPLFNPPWNLNKWKIIVYIFISVLLGLFHL